MPGRNFARVSRLRPSAGRRVDVQFGAECAGRIDSVVVDLDLVLEFRAHRERHEEERREEGGERDGGDEEAVHSDLPRRLTAVVSINRLPPSIRLDHGHPASRAANRVVSGRAC